MIPNGTRFIGIAPEVDLTERGSALLNKRTEPYTIDDIRGYKVFTALLTQSGGDFLDQLDYSSPTQNVTKGVTYNIATTDIGADFTNVGAPNNEEGTYFVAINNEIPNSWGESEGSALTFNTGAPVATVLENTIGSVWFTYTDIGVYVINSNGLFIDNKTTVLMPNGYQNNPYYAIGVQYEDINIGRITTSESTDGSNTAVNGVLSKTPIEIRVYN